MTSKDIIFLGNSITNGGEWSELLNNKHVKNRGISGDICMGVYDRLDAVLKGKPAKIFLLIGIRCKPGHLCRYNCEPYWYDYSKN